MTGSERLNNPDDLQKNPEQIEISKRLKEMANKELVVRDFATKKVKPKFVETRQEMALETIDSVESRIKMFFVGDHPEGTSYKIIDEPPEVPHIKVESIIKPSQEEKQFFDPGFKMKLDVEGKDTSDILNGIVERTSINIDKMLVSINGFTITLNDMLPPGWIFKFDTLTNTDESNGTCEVFKKEVTQRELISLTDFVALLHECGHAQDFTKNPPVQREITLSDLLPEVRSSEELGEKERKQIAFAQKRERNAWANTLRMVRKFNLPIEKFVKERIRFCLGSYDDVLAVVDKDPKSYEEFATSKKRRQRKKS